jgi:hypothetical protein
MNLLMLLGVLSLAKMEESVLKASANAGLAFKEKHVKSKLVSTFYVSNLL